MSSTRPAAAAWDAEYRTGRYHDEPPVPFLDDVITAAQAAGASRGLDIGCGNGRHLLRLLAAGFDMNGLDISAQAIAQLRARRPGRADRFVHGDLSVLPPRQRWPGLDIHFFGATEPSRLFVDWTRVLPVRADTTWRQPPGAGQWTQWEAIWQQPHQHPERRTGSEREG